MADFNQAVAKTNHEKLIAVRKHYKNRHQTFSRIGDGSNTWFIASRDTGKILGIGLNLGDVYNALPEAK